MYQRIYWVVRDPRITLWEPLPAVYSVIPDTFPDSRLVCVGFVVDEVTLLQGFPGLRFSAVSIILIVFYVCTTGAM
jgi:hypothetical protein